MRPNGLMPVCTSGTVHDDVKITLYRPPDNDDMVSIVFGEEQLTLDFYDPDVLDRLAALATEGARHLRERIAGTDDQLAELAG